MQKSEKRLICLTLILQDRMALQLMLKTYFSYFYDDFFVFSISLCHIFAFLFFFLYFELKSVQFLFFDNHEATMS